MWEIQVVPPLPTPILGHCSVLSFNNVGGLGVWYWTAEMSILHGFPCKYAIHSKSRAFMLSYPYLHAHTCTILLCRRELGMSILCIWQHIISRTRSRVNGPNCKLRNIQIVPPLRIQLHVSIILSCIRNVLTTYTYPYTHSRVIWPQLQVEIVPPLRIHLHGSTLYCRE